MNLNYNTSAGTIEILWICVGVLSIFVLVFLMIKKSKANTISVDQISCFTDSGSLFMKDYFALKLKGGRIRDLGRLKSQEELDQIKALRVKAEISIAIKHDQKKA